MSSQRRYYTPPINKLVVEKRIVDGKLRKVESYNGKIARVYDEDGKLLEDRSSKLKIAVLTPPLEPKVIQEKKLDIPEELTSNETSNLGNSSSEIGTRIGTSANIQLIPDDEVAKREDIDFQTDVSCPECKSKNIETLLHLENAKRYKCRDCNETFVLNKDKDSNKDVPEVSQKLENMINIQDISNKVEIAKIDPKESSIIETKKVRKETQENEIPVPTQIIKTDNKVKNDKDIPKVEDKIIQTNAIKAEQPKEKIEQNQIEQNQIEDRKIIKENKSMAEEILEEYKREQWAKKRDFEKNIEDMARVASENKGQISGISQKIEDVEGKLGDVDNKIGNLQENFQEKFGNLQENLQEKLGDIKKPVSDALGELCTGVDCIKTDLKKNQQDQQTYQQTIENKLEKRFQELGERLQKLEEPTYVCDNCGQDDIRVLSSFCPNCGQPIHNWTDPETGNPIAGWSPYWKRMRGTTTE